MAGAGLNVAVDSEEVQRHLRGIARRMRSMEPAMAVVEEVLATAVDDNFQEQGQRGGRQQWADLKDETWERRREGRGRGQGKILTDTGALSRSAQAGRRHDRRSAEVGTDLEYAATHQFGDPRRNIPARPFLFVTDEDVQEIADTIADYIDLGKRGMLAAQKSRVT